MIFFNQIFQKNHTKTELCLRTMINKGKINTHDAHASYGDTCLHTTISGIQKRYNIHFNREYKKLPRHRSSRSYAHYWLEGENLIRAKKLLTYLKNKRTS